ncbi:MAG: hypothetical protein ABIM88_03965 [candidate division WOR-3 bacterium]
MSFIVVLAAIVPSHSSLLIFPELDYDGPTRTGVGAILSNPAGLWGVGEELMVAGGFWFTDSRLTLAGLRAGSWGFRLSYLDYGSLEFQDETPDDEGGPSFRPYAFEASVMRAFLPEKETKLGIGFGYIRQGIYDEGYTAYHFSVGVLHTPERLRGLSVAAGIRNLGLDRITDLAEERIPTQFYAGLSYERGPARFGAEWARVPSYDTSGSYLSLTPTGTELRFKMDWTIREVLTPSVAYSYGREIDPLEFRVSFVSGKLGFSYGFRPSFLGFDALHLLSLRYKP